MNSTGPWRKYEWRQDFITLIVNECAKGVLVFCRKNWVKEPEDHGGRLPELHEVPDVSIQFLHICKYLESTFSPESSCFEQPAAPQEDRL